MTQAKFSSFCIQTEKAEEFKEHITPSSGLPGLVTSQQAQNQSRGKGVMLVSPRTFKCAKWENWEEL